MDKKRAVIVIPTYNERENIAKLIPVLQDVFVHIRNWDMQILIVDDTSPDRTADEVRKIQLKNKNVHLLINTLKSGLGTAYLKGMKQAFGKLGADLIFEFDADFSHDPEKIPEFLAKIDQGFDFVLGSRYIKGGSIPADWGFLRKFYSIVGNLVIMFVFTDFRIRDWTSGYRAIRKSVFAAISGEMDQEQFSGYTFQVGFLNKAIKKGFKVCEVPFNFIDREIGNSKLGSEYIKNTLQYILITRFKEITSSHVFRFGVVGGIGFVITASGSILFPSIPFVKSLAVTLGTMTGLFFLNVSAIATALATECAIISNFTLNNLFTFTDRRLLPNQIVPKFVQFNLASLGSIVISSLIVGVGTTFSGEGPISKLFWLVIATALVMFVNYLVYSKFIWKKK